MALIGNGFVLAKTPNFYTGGVIISTTWNREEMPDYGFGSFPWQAGYPDGYTTGYILPMKSGDMTARCFLDFSSTSNLAGGRYINATTTIDFSSTATGQSIGWLTGSSSLIITQSAILAGAIYGTGTSSIDFSITGDIFSAGRFITGTSSIAFASTGSLGGVGNLDASSTFNISGIGSMRADGFMSGSTVDTSTLTPQAIWQYGTRTVTNGITKADLAVLM